MVLINQKMLTKKDAVNRGWLPKLGYVRRVEIAEFGDAGGKCCHHWRTWQ